MRTVSTRQAVLAGLVAGAALAGCERPPVVSEQGGYRGTAMVQIQNPRLAAARDAAQPLPDAVPPASPEGPKAKDVFKNVQVLGELTVPEFTRTMLAITAWVSPKDGCTYCHAAGEDLSADKLYTKVVARRMLQMTRHINADWKAHVADTGVTCFTCHRGQPVPAQVWYTDPGPKHAGGASADSAGQNHPARQAGLSSLPFDPLTPHLLGDEPIRVVSQQALKAANPRDIKDTESTYALMTHISQSLGVNCTFCHNSRSFTEWPQSPPTRAVAYHGIRMARDLNKTFLEPLKTTFPADRLGPTGDSPKVSCATCHQGVNKPLHGAKLLKDHPALSAAATAESSVLAARDAPKAAGD